MAHRQAGKVNTRGFARHADSEGRNTGKGVGFAQADLVGALQDVLQQSAHFLALGAVVQRGDQFDRALQAFEIGLELAFDGGVKHGVLPSVVL